MIAKYCLASLVAGTLWGALGYMLIEPWARSEVAIGSMVASPVIGMIAGLAFLPVLGSRIGARLLGSLCTLFLAAILFGLAGGVADLLLAGTGPLESSSPSAAERFRRPLSVVLQPVSAILWGLTAGFLALFLWPLALLSHHIVGELSGVLPNQRLQRSRFARR